MALPVPNNSIEISFNESWLNQLDCVDYPTSKEQKLFYKQFLNNGK